MTLIFSEFVKYFVGNFGWMVGKSIAAWELENWIGKMILGHFRVISRQLLFICFVLKQLQSLEARVPIYLTEIIIMCVGFACFQLHWQFIYNFTDS